MLNLKKTAIAVLAFSSSAVFAGSMGPVCAPGNVTVPCASQAWDFGVQALYLKPSLSSSLYNGVTSYNPVNNTTTYNKTPYDWSWGFKLEGSYHFGTGNDLNLNWYHLSNSDTNTIVGDIIPASGLTIQNTVKPTWDAVNLEFGQHAHFGEWKNIRFHGGAQYAHIEMNDSAIITTAATEQVPSVISNFAFNRKFNGFGPRIGADYWYNFGNGFAMYAKGATALLVGSQSFNGSFASLRPDGTNVTGSATAFVPQVEAKLGATYGYAMAQGELSLDAGWMFVNYFNALSTPSAFVGTADTNFAVQGPFIGLKWVGNVA